MEDDFITIEEAEELLMAAEVGLPVDRSQLTMAILLLQQRDLPVTGRPTERG